MELTLAFVASGATTRILGVLGFLVLLPVVIFTIAMLGRWVVGRRHAQEFDREVKSGGDDDWLQRTIDGGGS
jgi:hypothetical protein